MSQPSNSRVIFLPAASFVSPPAGPFVVVVRTREEFLHWLDSPVPGVQWLQVEGLLEDADVWAAAAQGRSPLPLDVWLDNPSTEYASLYRLVDARNARSLRVTLPVVPGMMKALRLASSLQLSVRLLPGQLNEDALREWKAAAEFYLHDTLVDAPIEPFHSILAALCGSDGDSLWRIVEQDPSIFDRSVLQQTSALPRDFVETHLAELIAHGAECGACPWQQGCVGFFKYPDAAYSCTGIKDIFALLEEAAAEISRDLATAAAEAVVVT